MKSETIFVSKAVDFLVDELVGDAVDTFESFVALVLSFLSLACSETSETCVGTVLEDMVAADLDSCTVEVVER